MFMELGALHPRRLIPHPAHEQWAPAPMQRVGQAFDRMQSGGIDGGHLAEPQDDHLGSGDVLLQVEQLIAAAEQERSVGAIDGDTLLLRRPSALLVATPVAR